MRPAGIGVSVIIFAAVFGTPGRAPARTDVGPDGEQVRNRMVLTPDANPPRRWGGYAALHDLFFATASVGLGGGVSFCGGASFAPWAEGPRYLVAPSVSILSDSGFALAAGALWLGGGDAGGTGIASVFATIGGNSGSATVGLGAGFAGRDLRGRPAFLVGFRAPFAGDVEIVGENRFTSGFEPGLVSVGWRYTSGRVSVDLAAVYVARGADGGPAPLLPWFTVAFGY